MKISLIVLSLFLGLFNTNSVIAEEVSNPIEVSSGQYDLSVSDQVQIKVSAPTVENPVFVFLSDDPSVASVSSTGLITGVKMGETVIKISLVLDDEEFSSSVKVHVKGLEGNISLGISEFYLIRGLTYEVPYTLTGAFEGKSVSWSSSDTSVASVENGIVLGRSIGQATIRASVDDVVAEFTLYVTVPLKQVSFNPSSVSMTVEDVRNIPELVYVPFDTTSSRQAIFSSSNEEIVKVDGDNLVAVGEGNATIYVNVGGITSELSVSVRPKKSETGAEILNLTSKVQGKVLEYSADFSQEYKGNRYEVTLPFNEEAKFDSIIVRLPEGLLKNSMAKIETLKLDSEFLKKELNIKIANEKGEVLLVYYFDESYDEAINLKYSLEEIDEKSALYAKIGSRSYRLRFRMPDDYQFEVEVPAKLIDSTVSQYHFIYEVEKNNPLDTNQSASVDENGLLRFRVDANDNIISFSRISVRNNASVIFWFLGLIALGGVAYAFSLKKRREL